MKARTKKITIISVALIFAALAIFILKLSLKQKSSEIVVTSNIENSQTTKENDKIEDQWPVAKKEDPEKKLIESSKENSKEDQEKEASNEKEPSRQNEAKEKTSTNDTKENGANFIQSNLVDWGYRETSKRQINTIIIHSSYDALHEDPYELEGLLEEYREYEVAPHFVIDREGEIFQLVNTSHIAYHAGEGQMPDGRSNINAFSIGIELMNTQEDEYTSKQYKSLNKLVDFLEEKYNIRDILGHQDIAPQRKTDPWNFDWEKLESKNKSI